MKSNYLIFSDNRYVTISRQTIILFALAIVCWGCPGGTSKTTQPSREQKWNFKTVKIGNQEWMTNNLNVATFRNGDSILNVKTKEEWVKVGKEGKAAWCYYDSTTYTMGKIPAWYGSEGIDVSNPYLIAYGEKYGKLYNWYAVNDSRGLAPDGFHVPSDLEWTQLEEYLGKSNAGKKMKSAIGWKNPLGFHLGTNESGWSGLPGGFVYKGGVFSGGILINGNWWSSTEGNSNKGRCWDSPDRKPECAWMRNLNYNESELSRFSSNKRYGFYVRCIKD